MGVWGKQGSWGGGGCWHKGLLCIGVFRPWAPCPPSQPSTAEIFTSPCMAWTTRPLCSCSVGCWLFGAHYKPELCSALGETLGTGHPMRMLMWVLMAKVSPVLSSWVVPGALPQGEGKSACIAIHYHTLPNRPSLRTPLHCVPPHLCHLCTYAKNTRCASLLWRAEMLNKLTQIGLGEEIR